MFLQWIWFGMMAASVMYACLCGRGAQVMTSALEGTGDAIALTLRLGGGYLLFCGLTEIADGLQVPRWVERKLRPLLKCLMPGMGKASETVAMNLSANMLGLGNAATPLGMEAMRRLEEEYAANESVRHDMYMLLILNATSIQLLPTTGLALRAASGSADADAVLVPTLICTAVSTAVGALLGMLCRRREEKKRVH